MSEDVGIRDVLLRLEGSLMKHMSDEAMWRDEMDKKITTVTSSPAMRLTHENIDALSRLTKKMNFISAAILTALLTAGTASIWSWIGIGKGSGHGP